MKNLLFASIEPNGNYINNYDIIAKTPVYKYFIKCLRTQLNCS